MEAEKRKRGDSAGEASCEKLTETKGELTVTRDGEVEEFYAILRRIHVAVTYLKRVRRLRLGEGDANAINKYFLKMQADNSNFFYIMDLDEAGRAPKAIITDQDKAMQIAIAEIFSEARHRWCLWHIKKKLSEKLKGYEEYDSIKFFLKNAVYNSLSRDEFEESWNNMIERFELQDNEWLTGLYSERCRWVPIYVKDIFWAGMSTTQRSESMNSFFDGYVNSKTTLKQFVEQYDNALASKVEKENQEDFNSYNSMYPCITDYEMEKRIQSLYTNSKFKEFQQELKGKLYCEVFPIQNDSSKYEVVEDCRFGEKRRHVSYKVDFKEVDGEVIYNCKLYEFRGILCRHAISVLIHKRVYEIPSKYIMSRWRKDIKRCHTRVKISYNTMAVNIETQRFEKMCEAFFKVAKMAMDSDSKCEKVVEWTGKLKNFFDDHTSSDAAQPCVNDGGTTIGTETLNNDHPNIIDPVIVRGKGRSPTNRKISRVEKTITKKKGSKKKKVEKTGQDTSSKSSQNIFELQNSNDFQIPENQRKTYQEHLSTLEKSTYNHEHHLPSSDDFVSAPFSYYTPQVGFEVIPHWSHDHATTIPSHLAGTHMSILSSFSRNQGEQK
nr:PREDICTED: protein FAR1-RELATED SEQUENCE 1-like [Daucus carota subsp. sativus]